MPRFAALAPLSCAAFLAAVPAAKAQNPIPASVDVQERIHTVEVELTRDGATLRVTRSLFNPTLFQSRVDLPIPLPCEALLDDFQVEEIGAGGFSHWRAAELLTPTDAEAHFDTYFDAVFDSSLTHVTNADSAMLLTRDDWGCDANLSIYPVPPIGRRSFAYRVFVPSVYADGRYTIELPSFDGYGLIPELEVAGLADSSLVASVGLHELDQGGTTLDGSKSHTIVLSPHDAGRGRVRVVDLDVDALVDQTPAALAQLAADAGPVPRLHTATFEAPAELATLPAVRRAVVLIDGSRSVSDATRKDLQRFGAAYFEALAKQDARVEVLVFDREVRRVYHDFVPAQWGAEDLTKLEISSENGSEVGVAIQAARELLAEPSASEGADWIIVLSDLELRRDFDVVAEREAADASAPRIHVVRALGSGFAPAAADDPWTAVARAAGGMAWETNGGSAFADELVSPKRIWNLGLELEYADGSHRSESLDPRLDAGALREWSNGAYFGAAMTRAAFVGEVWGQRRAWTGSPSELEAKRLAGAIATHDDSRDFGDAVRTALAFHAQVISPFSSGWALAQFDGTAPAPPIGFGTGGCFGGHHGMTTRCGGVHSCGHLGTATPVDFATLAQEALDHCRPRADGIYAFETTDLEIVAVTSENRCLAEATWATDIRPTDSRGHLRIAISHAGGLVTAVDIADA